MTADKEVVLASLGGGNMGLRHAECLYKLGTARLKYACDLDESRGLALQRIGRHEKVTTEFQEVLDDPEVDGVIIATRHDSHPELAIRTANAGKHVFIEKPLALTVEACEEIATAVRTAGVQLVCGFQARTCPYCLKAKELVPEPLVVYGQMTEGRWPDASWAQDPITGGGNVLSQGVHCFDLVTSFNGSEPTSIYAIGGTMTHDPAKTEVIDTAACTIRFENGGIGHVLIGDFGMGAVAGKSSYQLFGRDVTATLYEYSSKLRVWRLGSGPHEEFTDSAIGVAKVRADPLGYLAQMQEFVESVRTNTPPPHAADLHAGARATALAIRAFESIRTGEPQEL